MLRRSKQVLGVLLMANLSACSDADTSNGGGHLSNANLVQEENAARILPSEARSNDPIRKEESVEQAIEAETRPGDEELRVHVPFADRMAGRWATADQSCNDPKNFEFAIDTYQHGDRNGTYVFEYPTLTMNSSQGQSVGHVTVIDPSTIEIDWVGWKKMRYYQCEVE